MKQLFLCICCLPGVSPGHVLFLGFVLKGHLLCCGFVLQLGEIKLPGQIFRAYAHLSLYLIKVLLFFNSRLCLRS